MQKTTDIRTRLLDGLKGCLDEFYAELDPIPVDLLSWADTSGLTNGKASVRLVLARQAALANLLIGLLKSLSADEDSDYVAKSLINKLPFGNLQLSTEKHYDESELQSLVTDLREALPEDVLGQIYEGLTPQAERRTLGQHWTPIPIAELMAAWASVGSSRILDPAVGSGRLIEALNRRADSIHRPYVCGYEISPLVLLIALVNSLLARPEEPLADLRLGDFLLDDTNIEKFDGVICNPPYTRHHHISKELKQLFSEQAFSDFGVKLSGFSSLFVYFFIRAIGSVKEGGKLAFITPSELYEASYSVFVKRIIKESVTPRAIITFDKSHQVFEGVDTAGCITLATKGVAENSVTALIEISEWPGIEEILALIESGEDQKLVWGTVRFVSTRTLKTTSKWSNMINDASSYDSLPTLGSISKVVRGIATGANSYFCLSSENAARNKIPEKYLVPVITKTRLIQNYRLGFEDMARLEKEGRQVWLFNYREPRDTSMSEVESYIQAGEDLELHKRSLLKLKKHKWYTVEYREPPPILFTYLGRTNTRFIYNEAKAQALNVFLLIYPKEEISRDPAKVKAMTALLNSSPIKRSLHFVGRSYGGDTIKLEPREMDRLPILDPCLLNTDELIQVNELFDDLCEDPKNAQIKARLDRVAELLISKYANFNSKITQESLF